MFAFMASATEKLKVRVLLVAQSLIGLVVELQIGRRCATAAMGMTLPVTRPLCHPEDGVVIFRKRVQAKAGQAVTDELPLFVRENDLHTPRLRLRPAKGKLRAWSTTVGS
jgi:hypothetical protein